MRNERFLEETLPASPVPSVTDSVTDDRCCLCDEELGRGRIVQQRFETDATGTLYSAHAKCAHEYGITARALRRVADDVTPSF